MTHALLYKMLTNASVALQMFCSITVMNTTTVLRIFNSEEKYTFIVISGTYFITYSRH